MGKFILALVLVLTQYSCLKKQQTSSKEVKGWNDFSGLNLKVTGTVYYVNNNVKGGNFHGRGIVRVNILQTNIKSYDPRNTQSNYYCIIKDNKAELYDNHVDDISVGDTIEIDTNEETIRWLNHDKDGKVYSLSIGEPSFFNFINKNKLQEF